MKTLAALTLSVALGGSACQASVSTPTPIPPLPPVPPSIPPVAEAQELWTLATTLTSVTGPEACISKSRVGVGRTTGWKLTVGRSEGAVHLTVEAPQAPGDRYEYRGTVVGDEVTADGEPTSGYFLCGGIRVDYSGNSSILGYFTADGRTFKAEETVTLHSVSAEPIVFRTDWLATRE